MREIKLKAFRKPLQVYSVAEADAQAKRWHRYFEDKLRRTVDPVGEKLSDKLDADTVTVLIYAGLIAILLEVYICFIWEGVAL